MYLVSVFVILYSFLGQHVYSDPDTNNSNQLHDAGWRCGTVCIGSGGTAEFDPKNKICKCTLDKNIDEEDKEAIFKNANFLGVRLTLNTPSEKPISKREVGATPQHGENDIVGQRPPQRFVTPKPRSQIRPLSTSRRPTIRTTTRRPMVITPPRRSSSGKSMNAQQRLQQIQEQINERRRSRARTRTGPHLQMRAGFQSEATPNLVERLKEKQRERLEKLKTKSEISKSRVLNKNTKTPGQTPQVAVTSQENAETPKKAKEDSGANEKKSHELITQDPSLYIMKS